MEGRSEDILFEAELRPNRSATPTAIRSLTIVLCCVLIPAGLIFMYVGAWPVFGFLGLELVLLIALLKFHYRRSYMVERIAITENDLTVERVDPWGRRRRWSFQRPWLQVNIEEQDDHRNTLELRSRGKALSIGAFLTAEEKVAVARDLRRALLRYVKPAAPESA